MDAELETVYLHNWLYSVVPLFPEKNFDFGGYNTRSAIFLAGYCRNCDIGFTEQLRTSWDGSLVLETLGIPKTGCKGPNK